MFRADVLLIAVVVASLPICLSRPWIGVLIFVWLGSMHPHRLAGGVAYNFPLSKLVAAATLIGLLFTKERYALPRRSEVYLLGALWLAVLASTLLTAIEPQRAWIKFTEVSKILLMSAVTIVLFQDRAKLRALLLVLSLSLGLLGITGSLWGVDTGFQQPLFGPADSSIGDNNAFGFALVIALPLLACVRQQVRNVPLRGMLLIAFGLSIIALFTTYSRGAFLGFCLVLPLIVLQLRMRDKGLLIVATTACLLIYFAPQLWIERMLTITPSVYREDPSGAQRMKSWYVALRLGIDHALLGAGFYPFSPAVYERYLPGYADYHDAHNHFLQVFAEHGLPGLVVFVALMGVALFHLFRLARSLRHDPERHWIADDAYMIGIAIVAFAAEGIFINMPYFDLYFNLIAVAVVLQEIAASASGRACQPLGKRWVVAVMRRTGIIAEQPPARTG